MKKAAAGLALSLSALFGGAALLWSSSQASAQQPPPPPAKAPVPAPAPAAVEDVGAEIRFKVEKYQLPNGLTVLLYEDHTVPLISYQTWFRVGSKNEQVGLTGIAHLFEHMMFKGAKRYSGEQFDSLLQSNGAVNNAFTTNDYTGYYENLPSAKLELVMDLESDRMANLNVTTENLNSERDVVREERRYRVDNNPMGVLRESLFDAAFRVHPYRWPVIGHMEDLANITQPKADEFFKTYYAPNNAVLVVAGDIEPGLTKKLIEKYYAGLKPHDIPNTPRPEEPEQKAPRSQFVSRPVQNVTFSIAFHTPKGGTDDAYALDLLAGIMGTGTSSRMYQRLVYHDQSATSAVTYNMTLQDAGMFEIFVSLKPGADFMKAQRAVYGEIWRPRSKLVDPKELQKAKNQVMKSYVDSLKTIQGKAEALAMNEILYGNYEELFKDLDRYNRVTAQQIKAVAQKYLAPEKSTLVVLRPAKKGAK
jgi:zinc protease